MVESISCVQLMGLFGGMHSTAAAWANVAGFVAFAIGRKLYIEGYEKHYDEKGAAGKRCR